MTQNGRMAALALLLSGVAACAKTGDPVAPPTIVADYGLPLAFFDWDRADLDDRARGVVAAFARRAIEFRWPRIEVIGHTDRSGLPDYNQRLSERRASNTAAELVRLGVDRRIISVAALGETRLLIPTRDGAREPHNRRVELVAR